MKIGFKAVLMMVGVVVANVAMAANWDTVTRSGDYYYGKGTSGDKNVAYGIALSNIIANIAESQYDQFPLIAEPSAPVGSAAHKAKVDSCMKTYSYSIFNRLDSMMLDSKITVGYFMEKSALPGVFAERINKARNQMAKADYFLTKGKIDDALQYYYWAYSLTRSLPCPTDATDSNGEPLLEVLPKKIKEVLGDLSVRFLKRENEHVEIFFEYEGNPVSSLVFRYSDGQGECMGSALDGYGYMEMSPAYNHDGGYRVNVEYEFKHKSLGDAEIKGVLGLVNSDYYAESELQVTADGGSAAQRPQTVATPQSPQNVSTIPVAPIVEEEAAASAAPRDTISKARLVAMSKSMDVILKSIRTKRYSDAESCFTIEANEMFHDIISYGRGRIINDSGITYYPGLCGRVVVRGLVMSFSFGSGTQKKTFVEDVVFTFNPDDLVENVAFGLGKVAMDDIYNNPKPGWKPGAKEVVVGFLENYKTAYSLKRIDYINSIYADDAVIIVGHVIKKATNSSSEMPISLKGQEVIKYNRVPKDDYIAKLRRTFGLNEFINLNFTNNDVRWLEKYPEQEIYAIQIGQEYSSSTYSDRGYLFLLVDMTNRDEPQIKVRTWQPNEEDMDKLFHEGYFVNG